MLPAAVEVIGLHPGEVGASQRSLGAPHQALGYTRDLVECLAAIGRRPIRASIATLSFKVISVQRGDSQKSYNSLLFPAVVFLPLCIDTNHNDVG
jgi:hypothetical protein